MPNINELTLAKELIKFPSVTPKDVGAIRYLSKQLKKLGFDCKILEFKDKNSNLPKNMDESLTLFENDEDIKSIFNEKFVRSIAAIRRVEYQAYLSVISSWEREYLLLNV